VVERSVDPTVPWEPVQRSSAEAVRAVLAVPTVARLLAACAVLGLLSLPLLAEVLRYLDERRQLGPASQLGIAAGLVAVAGTTSLLAGRVTSARLREGPSGVL